MTSLFRKNSIRIAFGLFAIVGISGCASVESTAIYYTAYTIDQYPPKPKDTFIPVIGNAPDRPFKKIGRLAFSSTLGYRFMRRSIDYNARIHGADAVILKEVDEQTQVYLTEVPPNWNYIPYTSYVPYTVRGYGGGCYTEFAPYTNWQPIFQPGYISEESVTTTAIDAEMIVFKR
jgi:hypothetical protein